MKILVVSGSLGAGKTTFIQTMVQKSKQQFCILENEYAGSKVDKAVIEDSGDVNVWEMMEGCICCSMKNDFTNTILNISNVIDPPYLIVEATGIGFLSNIIKNIQTIEYDRIGLLQPVAIIDADTIYEKQKNLDPVFMDQVKTAKILIISKGESLSEEEQLEIIKILKTMNPEAQIISNHYSKKDSCWWKKLLDTFYDGHVEEKGEEKNNWDTLTLSNITIKSFSQLLCFLEDALNYKYGEMKRVKGIIPIKDLWLRCDIAGDRYAITEASPQEESNIVFIGNGILKQEIKKQFTFMKAKACLVNNLYGWHSICEIYKQRLLKKCVRKICMCVTVCRFERAELGSRSRN